MEVQPKAQFSHFFYFEAFPKLVFLCLFFTWTAIQVYKLVYLFWYKINIAPPPLPWRVVTLVYPDLSNEKIREYIPSQISFLNLFIIYLYKMNMKFIKLCLFLINSLILQIVLYLHFPDFVLKLLNCLGIIAKRC